MSVLPILSAVFFVVPPPNEMDIDTRNVDTDASPATDRSFAPTPHQ